MKANELRLENLITLKEEVFSVIDNGFGFLSLKNNQRGVPVRCKISEVSPMLITEEWLLKFGFSKRRNDESWFYKKYKSDWAGIACDIDLNINTKSCWISNSNSDGSSPCTKNEIKYVHQLQNLYFSLTGNELSTTTQL